MASNPNNDTSQQYRVGEHWSGGNTIPTVQKFMERLEVDKKSREEYSREQEAREKAYLEQGKQAEAFPHKPRKAAKGRTRLVTDPTTGKDIEVEDLEPDSMDVVKDPTVCHLF
jgi:hypothetical protein